MGLRDSGQQDSWTPQACTLPTSERPLRAAAFADLFSETVLGAERVEPTRLRLELRPSPQVAGRAAELVTAETACCSFFTFTLTARLAAWCWTSPCLLRTPKSWTPWQTGRRDRRRIRDSRKLD